MTPFLATSTAGGDELVARLRSARTRADITALIQLVTDDRHSKADHYNFFCIAADLMVEPARARAALYDAAGQVALCAHAYHEALVALERAQRARPTAERRKEIDALRKRVRGPSLSTS